MLSAPNKGLSGLLSTAVLKTVTKTTWGWGQSLFHLKLTVHDGKSGTWRQDLKQALEEAALWLIRSACLYTQDHLPRDGTTHCGLGPPT